MDRRELILSRMLVTLSTITPVPPATTLEVRRNRGELPEGAGRRPAILLLDGTEDHLPYVERKTRTGLSPNKMRLRPQIFVLLEPRPPKNEGVGEELNAYRVKILKALDQDKTLEALLGANGEFVYERGATDMQSGSSMQGEFQFHFSMIYPFNPSEF